MTCIAVTDGVTGGVCSALFAAGAFAVEVRAGTVVFADAFRLGSPFLVVAGDFFRVEAFFFAGASFFAGAFFLAAAPRLATLFFALTFVALAFLVPSDLLRRAGMKNLSV